MFRYTKNNLFDRCGAREVSCNKKPAEFTGKFIEIGGEQIPLMNFHFQTEVDFTRYLCLRTFLGYIPVERIESFKDIFKKDNYLQDATEWVMPYYEQSAGEDDKAKVKQLSVALGKHWKK